MVVQADAVQGIQLGGRQRDCMEIVVIVMVVMMAMHGAHAGW